MLRSKIVRQDRTEQVQYVQQRQQPLWCIKILNYCQLMYLTKDIPKGAFSNTNRIPNFIGGKN